MRSSRDPTSAPISVRRGGSMRSPPSPRNPWRDGSPASIARRLTLHRRRLFAALQVAFALAVAWYAWRRLSERWSEFEQARLTFEPRWGWIIPASIIVLMTYLLLVRVWASHLRTWGVRVPFVVAARLWFISNLGRYVPGKVWGI